jgi:hypothetical protein
MKIYLTTISLVAASLSVSSFAQSPLAAAPAAQTQSSNTVSTNQWTPPYGKPVKPLTRAQVYKDLLQAEKDGQIEHLNKTLYGG